MECSSKAYIRIKKTPHLHIIKNVISEMNNSEWVKRWGQRQIYIVYNKKTDIEIRGKMSKRSSESS